MNIVLICLDIVSLTILVTVSAIEVFFFIKDEKYDKLTRPWEKRRPIYKTLLLNVLQEVSSTALLLFIISVILAVLLAFVRWVIFSCCGIQFDFTAGFVFKLSLVICAYCATGGMIEGIKTYKHYYYIGDKWKGYHYQEDDGIWKFFATFLKSLHL